MKKKTGYLTLKHKILFFGGTRFFGKEIISHLANLGHKVTFFTRGQTRFEKGRAVHFPGDRLNEQDIKRVAESEDWDFVIDNICYEPKALEYSLKYFKNLKKYILTSTVSVYRYSHNSPSNPYHESDIDFDWQPEVQDLNNPHWKYAFGKKEAEKILHQAKTFPFTIFRPAMIYGPLDPQKRLAWYRDKIHRQETISLAPRSNFRFQFAYCGDLSKIYAECLTNKKTDDRVFNLASPDDISLLEILNRLAFDGKVLLKTEIDSVHNESQQGPLSYQRDWLQDTSAFRATFNSSLSPIKTFLFK